MWVTKVSALTRKTHRYWVADLTEEMVNAWHDGTLIQDAMPKVAPEWREYIRSGITPAEWDVYARRQERMEEIGRRRLEELNELLETLTQEEEGEE